MKYTYENLTLNISDIDPDYMGQCRFVVPFAHKQFLKDCCGMDKSLSWDNDEYTPIFIHNYGEVYVDQDEMHYWSDSPDILIAYMSWLLQSDKDESIDVEYSHFYWGIHDVQHAIYDESGCTVYVDGPTEEARLKDGFAEMNKLGYYPTYEMTKEIEEAFSARFGYNISLEEYLEEYQEDYAYDE